MELKRFGMIASLLTALLGLVSVLLSVGGAHHAALVVWFVCLATGSASLTANAVRLRWLR